MENKGGGRLSQSRRRACMAELKEQGTTWAAAKKVVQNRTCWKAMATGLCSTRRSGV